MEKIKNWCKKDHSNLIFTLLIIVVSIIFFNFSFRAQIIDSDSGFEYTNAQNILLHHKIEQGPIVQQFLNTILLSFSHFDYRSILVSQTILSIFIVIITYLFIKEKVDKKIAMLTPLIFLFFSVFFFGNYSLKQYPLFLFLLLLFIYCFNIFLNKRGEKYLFLSAFFLSLTIMTHLMTLPFVGFVFLYYCLNKIFRRKRIYLKDVFKFYLFLLLIVSPFFIWRVMNTPNLQYALAYPSSWFTVKYGLITNEEFWGFASPFTFSYFQDLYNLMKNWVFFPVLLPIVIFGLFKYKDKLFIISWFLLLLAPYLIGRGVLGWVYMYPFVPLVVILTLSGLDGISKIRSGRKVFIIIVCIFTILSFIQYSSAQSIFEQTIKSQLPAVEDAKEFNKLIPKGANILFRSRSLSNLLPFKNVLQITRDLSEEDAITYLSWTSDKKISELFKKYSITYVILYKDLRFENSIYIWFVKITGSEPIHYKMIQTSSYFQKIYEGKLYTLYKFVN